MSKWKFLAPVAAFAVTGCLASKADIVLLQDEIRTMRAMQARSDSSRRVSDSTRRVAADSAIMLSLRAGDSLKAFSQRFAGFQANVNGELFEIQRQLITVQQLTGSSTKSIMQVKSALEERAQSAAGSDSSAPQQPGPNQLFSASFDNWRRGSNTAARAGFEELLRRYPDFEQASAALYYIGETWAGEKKYAQADSVFQLVVSKYPKANDASTALYKLGMSKVRQGKNAEARELLQKVMREYPRSTEYTLAEEALKTIK
jgi:tol-pal system protein YbgF